MEDFDLAFLMDQDILALITPTRLLRLGIRLWAEAIPAIADRVADVARDADLDSEPESHFEYFTSGLNIIEILANVDASAEQLIESGRDAIEEAISALTEQKEAKEAEEDRHNSEGWEYMESASHTKAAPIMQRTFGPIAKRSLFDDVDA